LGDLKTTIIIIIIVLIIIKTFLAKKYNSFHTNTKQNNFKMTIKKINCHRKMTECQKKRFYSEKLKTCLYALTLKIQGISFLLAWMTSDSRTELAENSSSLLRIKACTSTIYEIFYFNI